MATSNGHKTKLAIELLLHDALPSLPPSLPSLTLTLPLYTHTHAQTSLIARSNMRWGLGRLPRRLSSPFPSSSSRPPCSRLASSSASASSSSSLPIIDLAPLVDPSASERHKLQCAEALHHVRLEERREGGREGGREGTFDM